jgi:hypothetical protein
VDKKKDAPEEIEGEAEGEEKPQMMMDESSGFEMITSKDMKRDGDSNKANSEDDDFSLIGGDEEEQVD